MEKSTKSAAKEKGHTATAEPESGEQMDLIEVHPENSKEIIRAAKAYKVAQKARTEALAREIKEKGKLLAYVKESKIVPDADGKCKFKLDGMAITVTPRDELVRVKFDSESDDPTA